MKAPKNVFEVVGGIVKITITKMDGAKYTAIVDQSDFHKVIGITWGICKPNPKAAPYVCSGTLKADRRKGQPSRVFLHRLIAETPADLTTDHINFNKMDNRRCNLRNVTQADNNRNRRGYEWRESAKGYFYRGNKKYEKPWVVHMRTVPFEEPPHACYRTEAEAQAEVERRRTIRKLLSLKQDDSREEGDRTMAGCSLEGANGSGLVLSEHTGL